VSKTTRATQALQQAGVSFAVATYDYDPGADRIGLQAAEAMGVPPRIVLKTLMAEADGKPVCVVVPSDREVGMKKLAAAFGAKSAQMMRPADAERGLQIRLKPQDLQAALQAKVAPLVA
jgi:Cys-tRNA(Pro)/Cys-tRNA(Cys) deacylase